MRKLSSFSIETEKVVTSSLQIVEISERLTALKAALEGTDIKGALSGRYNASIDSALQTLIHNVSNEAAQMDSLGNALKLIADKYRETEDDILMKQSAAFEGDNVNTETSKGDDDRGFWDKLWDRINENEADLRMKKALWKVLQDDKYSEKNWDNATIDERKQLLQDYMYEVAKIYGLQDVNLEIVWDSSLTYEETECTFGYYRHSDHTVTLNESVLTDSVGTWDSYDMFETVSHELRHAYQHEAVDHPEDFMVSPETIQEWKDNFDDYIDADDDYEKYRDQPVERDARDFEIGRNDIFIW
jgi:hypothetical protein